MTNTSETPTEQDFVCRICGEPIELDEKTKVLMSYFSMPRDGGVHAECLGGHA